MLILITGHSVGVLVGWSVDEPAGRSVGILDVSVFPRFDVNFLEGVAGSSSEKEDFGARHAFQAIWKGNE